jgi:hypothetical protein
MLGGSQSQSSYLTIEELNGVHVIRELNSAVLGRCRFALTKSMRNRVQSEGSAPAATVAVSTAGL